VLGAALLLLGLTPVLLTVAAYVKCTSRGPMLFRQRRFGLGGRSFRIWKFRTMRSSVDTQAHGQYVRDLMTSGQAMNKLCVPQGLIPGGSLLRATGIDELPQLVNVLLGQMSLVGPRPDVIPISEYQEHQRLRFQVLPGITGLWQVSGKNRTTFEQMIELDVQYARRCSFWLDAKIILRTIPAVFRQFMDKRSN
jgi:lipopolysaccharide/colanic/teichoic acid biosynthesis glycosyltransferase